MSPIVGVFWREAKRIRYSVLLRPAMAFEHWEMELQLQLQHAMAPTATEAHQDAGRTARQGIYPAPTSISEMIKPATAPRCNTATVIGHCYRINVSWFQIKSSSIYRLQHSATSSRSPSQRHLFISGIHTVETFHVA